MARTVTRGGHYGGVPAEFAVGLGVAGDQAHTLAIARGVDLAGAATPIGLGCRACFRGECPQRSLAPAGRALMVSDRERRLSALTFAGD
jgi:predicted transcriptional regulator